MIIYYKNQVSETGYFEEDLDNSLSQLVELTENVNFLNINENVNKYQNQNMMLQINVTRMYLRDITTCPSQGN